MSYTRRRSGADGLGLAALGVGGRRLFVGYAVLAAGRAIGLVLIAQAIADGTVSVIDHSDDWRLAIAGGACGALLRAVSSWITTAYGAGTALAMKQRIRGRLVDRMIHNGRASVAGDSVLAARQLDELDKYFRDVLPAVTSAAVVPVFLGARILLSDWLSAVIVASTIALVPVFMALIGIHTQRQVAAANDALTRLSTHLMELARGLPVLVGLGRAEEQTAALTAISDEHRVSTMKTLRVAFLSSLALELISTISVAVVAVTIGFRLVWGDVDLDVALLVLVLAPECFTPFRDLGAAFHASQNARDAVARVRVILAAPLTSGLRTVSRGLGVTDLTVRYRDRDEDAVHLLSFDLRPHQITALQGRSGAGKSTVLSVLAGLLRTDADVSVSGVIRGIRAGSTAWLPQNPRFVGSTVRGELQLYGANDIFDDESLALTDRLGITPLLDSDPAELSPGEGRRVALARVFLRVRAGAKTALLDEPTAHLDDANCQVVIEMIAELGRHIPVVLASHDHSVNALAGSIVRIGPTSSLRERPSTRREQAPTGGSGSRLSRMTDRGTNTTGWSALVEFLRTSAARYLAAIGLGTLSVAFSVSLIAVSGWLIVKASEHPSIMYLGVAIVAVRFFGIGRSGLHYAERLVMHNAVFQSTTVLRVALWRSLTQRGATSRKSLGGATVLDRLIRSADEVRDLVPRVVLPIAVAVLTSLATIVTVFLLDPELVAVFSCGLAGCLLVAPAVALLGDGRATSRVRSLQAQVLRGTTATLAASGDLTGNGIAQRAAELLRAADVLAGKSARKSLWAIGASQAVVVASCVLTSMLTFTVTAAQVQNGLPIEMVAVLALLPLALIDSMASASTAIQLWPALSTELARVSVEAAAPSPEMTGALCAESIHRIELDDLGAAWPDFRELVFDGVNAHVDRGEWLIVEGASGSGKSTLLSVLLGYLPPSTGRFLVDGKDASRLSGADLRKHIAWAPQDGYLFDSTLRANLLLARGHDDAPTDDELVAALRGVGLGDMIATLTDGLSTPVGAGGSALSGGQRQRVVVARTLLTRADVVLLDEPTAHLDEDAAQDLMSDLRYALRDRIVVLVTHHEIDLRAEDSIVRLGKAESRAVSGSSPTPARERAVPAR